MMPNNKTYRAQRAKNKKGGLRFTVYGLLLVACCLPFTAAAQVTVGGNVFGGGNLAAVSGNSSVTLNQPGTVIGTMEDDGEGHQVLKASTGDVFGGGNAAGVSGTATVTLTSGKVSGGLYGGCNTEGTVGGDITVALNGGTVGVDGTTTDVVYGGGFGHNTATGGDVTVTLGSTTVYGNLYGGSALGSVNGSSSDSTTVTIGGNGLNGKVFGGGMGSGSGAATQATTLGNVTVNYNTANANLAGIYGGANVNGDVAGDINVNIEANVGTSGDGNGRDIFGGGLGAHTSTDGNVTVTVEKLNNEALAPIIYGDLYGGSGYGEVGANGKLTKVDFKSGTLNGTIYGGGMGQASPAISATVSGDVEVAIAAGTITTGVYGGCNERGNVVGDITVDVTGSTIGANGSAASVFGGGYGANTTTGGDVLVNINGAGVTVWGDVYGGSGLGDVNDASSDYTTVNILNGEVKGDIFGGGLGDTTSLGLGHYNYAAKEYGVVTVNIGNVNPDYDSGDPLSEPYLGNATIGGNVYGCNNTYGSPQDTVVVNIYKTAHTTTPTDNTYSGTAYAIRNVFGGGKKADYTASKRATVNVYTCDNTIDTLYGGGDAAAVTGSKVVINGGRFNYVFGGGNGAGAGNPGADIGSLGITLDLHGGTIGTLVSASNEKGDIDGSIKVNVDHSSSCDEEVTDFFGGANMVDIATDVTTTIECGAGTFRNVYGGSNKADIDGNVSLTIQGGTIGRVFGGSKGDLSSLGGGHSDVSANITGNVTLTLNGGSIGAAFGGSNINGTIDGTITVNVNDLGVEGCELEIDSVFGAGNLTAYNPTTPGSYPAVNIINGTVNDVVFGGGKQAAVTSSPVVTIGDNNAAHRAIVTGSVFGGGDAAAVTGNTTVTYNDNNANSYVGNIYGGGNAAGITGSTQVTLTRGRVTNGIYGGCNSSGTVTGNSTVDLLGGQVGTSSNGAVVFGGGYGQATNIDGNVLVTMGNIAGTANPVLYADIYGGSALGNVNTKSSNVNVDTKVNNTDTTTLDILSGVLDGNIYGGGLGQRTPSAIAPLVHGMVQINIGRNTGTNELPEYTGFANLQNADIYGCNNVNGSPQNDVHIDVYATAHPSQTLVTDTTSHRSYAIADLYGGGNAADYAPENGNASSSKKTYIHVYGCNNTIGELFGGGNAAAVVGDSVFIEGGRFNEIFGGGNGAVAAANVGKGGIHLNARSGRVGYIFEQCNKRGEVNPDAPIIYKHGGGDCNNGILQVDYHFCGGNIQDVYGDSVYTFTCSDKVKYMGLYGGCRLGRHYGNITLVIEGGTIGEVYGGSMGMDGYSADVRKYPSIAEVTGHEEDYPEGILTFLNANENLQHTGGNVTVIIKGGDIGSVFGGCNVNGNVEGRITVIIDSTESDACPLDLDYVYGGGNVARYIPDTTENYNYPYIQLKKGHVNQDVFGGGHGSETDINAGIVTSNPHIVMAPEGGKFWVKGNIYGGGEMASVGRYTRDGSGKPTACAANTGHTTIEISAGKVGPAVLKMPDYKGHVFGGSKGAVGDTTSVTGNPKLCHIAYVNTSDVTISGTAFIKGSVYGGGESGRIFDSTYVKIQGGQIGCGWNEAAADDAHRDLNRVYTDAEWLYDVTSDNTKFLYECNHWPFGNPSTGKYDPYDPYEHPQAYDGHTFYGNVFGGGSGMMPYKSRNVADDNDSSIYIQTAGRVIGNTRVEITDGHILTNIYGGCELGDVLDTCTVIFHGGTLGVPRTLAQIEAHPVTCYLFGAGKGDERVRFNTRTNVKEVRVTVDGGRIYGSVFGGGEDGHVMRDVLMDIKPGAKIGTWGTSYVDGNVFGGGRGFSGNALTAGNVGGDITVNITGGTMLGSIYGGGRLASVGYGLYPADDARYGVMRPDNQDDDGNTVAGFSRGHITVSYGNVYGGGVGHAALTAAERSQVGRDATSDSIPTFAGLTGGTIQVNISGGAINNNVYGAGELASVGTINTVVKHTDKTTTYCLSWPYEYTYHGSSGDARVTITGGTIGFKSGGVTTGGDIYGSARGTVGDRYVTGRLATARVTHVNINLASASDTIFGTVYGSGENGHVYDSAVVTLTNGLVLGNVFGGGKGVDTYTDQLQRADESTYDTLVYDIIAGKVFGNTKVNILGGRVAQNVYGGGNLASVGIGNYKGYGEATGTIPSADSLLAENSGHCYVTILGGIIGPDSIINGTIYNGDYAVTTGHVYGAGKGIVFPTAKKVGFDYDRDYYVAYVNKTFVVIGDSNNRSCQYTNIDPHVTGIVFGGGENGHVRFDTYVQTNRGQIGVRPLDATGKLTSDVGHWANRGNIFGAGRGEDKLPNGKYCQSAGSVTRNTRIDVLGARIYRNVQGGGAMASVGPIKGRSGDSSTCVINVRLPLATDTLGGPSNTDNAFGGYIGGGSRGIPSPDGTRNDSLATCHNSQINFYRGRLKNTIYGGGENGQMLGNTQVNVYDGYVRSAIYGGGKGSWKETEYNDGHDYTDDTLSGYVYGNTEVNLLGGTVPYTYGGCRRASVGGNATINIGRDNSGTYEGNVSFQSSKRKVYGGNQYAGSPKGNIYVNVYKTAHTATDAASYTENDATYAIGYVYGGSYNSPYLPKDSGHYAQVHIYGCDNTVGSVYGGCAAANAGAKPGIGASTKLIIDGGRFGSVFGGGDGTYDRYLKASVPANIYGTAETEIHGGKIDTLFGGSNFMGQADTIRISVDNSSGCGNVEGDEFFGGSSLSNLGTILNPTVLSTTLGCGVKFKAVYGGSNKADIIGDVTLIIKGGQYDEVYAGSKGAIVAASASDGMKDTVKSDITGNTHLIIRGGKVHRAFGGSNINGNITGTITVDIDSTYDNCDWDVDYVYGGSNLTQYIPDNSDYKYSPKVNIIHGTVDTNVFGGGRGTKDNKLDGLVRCNTQVNVSGGQVKGNVYGGGEMASIDGDAYVNVSGTALIGYNKGITIGGGDSLSFVYGGGKGKGDDPLVSYNDFADVRNTHVTVSGGQVSGSVFGGAEDGHVLGNTNVIISNTVADSAYHAAHNDVAVGTVLTTPVIGSGGYTHELDGCVLGAGRNSNNIHRGAGRVAGHTYVTVNGGRIRRSVFGGGSLARVGVDDTGSVASFMTEHLKKKDLSGDSLVNGNTIPAYDSLNHGSTFVEVCGTTDTVLGVRKTRYNYAGKAVADSLGFTDPDSIKYKNYLTTTYCIPGTDSIVVFHTTIGGPDDSTLVDNDYTIGDIFGGGKGDSKDTLDIFGGRVMNTNIWVHGSPRIMADIYAGGEMSCIGWYDTGTNATVVHPRDAYYENTGYTRVEVSGSPYTGTPFEFSETNIHGGRAWTLIDSTGRLYHTCSGNIYGGGQGYVEEGYRRIHNWVQMGRVRETHVIVNGGRFLGNVFGGGSRGIVKEDCNVTINGGTFGCIITDSLNSKGDKRYAYGSIFGGGYGNHKVFWHYNDSCFVNGTDTIKMRAPEFAGRVYGNTILEITGGHIMGNVYGGGDMASTGWVERDDDGKFLIHDSTAHHNGLCTVIIRNDTNKTTGAVRIPVIGPLDHTLMNGHVYGGGKGVPIDPKEIFKTYCNVNETHLTVSGGHIHGSTFGGGADCHVLGHTSTYIHRDAYIGSDGYTEEYDGCVFGGGRNARNSNATAGRVQGHTYITVDGGRIQRTILGGGALARTGVDTNGRIDAFIEAGLYDSINHGSTNIDVSGTYTDVLANQMNTDYNKRFIGTTTTEGVAENYVRLHRTTIGAPNGPILVDNDYTIGDIFGGGKGDTKDTVDIMAGRVMNTYVTVSGSPRIMADIYAGGEMSCVGWYDTTGANTGVYYPRTGYTHVEITNDPRTGTPYEFSCANIHYGRPWTLIDSIGRLYHTCSGNVYGGGQGYVEEDGTHRWNWVQMGRVYQTDVKIHGGHFMGNVFGGGSRGIVKKDCYVTITGGTFGNHIVDDTTIYKKIYDTTFTNNEHTEWSDIDSSKYDTLVFNNRYNYGSIFGGGYGNHKTFWHYNDSCFVKGDGTQKGDTIFMQPLEFAGRVYGNTHVKITGGHIMDCVFGGGDLASTGWVERDANGIFQFNDPDKRHGGVCNVEISGNTIVGPLDYFGHNAYVYAAGRGVGYDPTEEFKTYCNVNEAHLIVALTEGAAANLSDKGPDQWDTTTMGGRIWGSLFGGGADSHVLDSVSVVVHSGLIGTQGTTSYDGNIFGGGRNYLNTNHTNGRVQGNIRVFVDGGTLQGTIFGGGRLALSGIDTAGHFIDSTHGNVDILVRGDVVIGNHVADSLLKSDESCGDIFGSGKGDVKNYEDVWAGRVTNSRITVKDTVISAVTYSPRIYGSIFGGGEMASLGYWDDTITDGEGHVVFHTDGTGGTDYGVMYENTGRAVINLSGNLTLGSALEYTVAPYKNPGNWTIYESTATDTTLIHTCTGNVFGGGQGDVDPSAPRWVSMGRSASSVVNISGGTYYGNVYGGSEQGIVTGDTRLNISGGTFGYTGAINGQLSKVYTGDIYAAGYGCDDPNDAANLMVELDDNDDTVWTSPGVPSMVPGYDNDSTADSENLGLGWTPDVLAGRTYGDVRVDITGGTIHGSVYGGGSFASVGYELSSAKGNTYVYIGIDDSTTVKASNAPAVSKGNATIDGEVFGANNFSGTPYGNTEVHIYKTAHNAANTAPTAEATKALTAPDNELTGEDVEALPHNDNNFALSAVYGGGNKAAHTPTDTIDGTTLVHVHYCEENTIRTVYGGGNAASTRNNHIIIDGGYIYEVFGGGNGAGEGNPGADVSGTAWTEIKGGLITDVFGGSNSKGNIGNTRLDIDPDGTCDIMVANTYGGSNEADGGGGEVNLMCGTNIGTFYGGSRKANLVGDITLNVYGGTYENIFGGSQGTPDSAANITGNVTVNFYGGNVQHLFGGSDVNGNITGTVLVNVDIDPYYKCDDGLRLDTVYGGGHDAAYTPFDPFRASPTVNIMNNRYYTFDGTPGTLTDSAYVHIIDVFGGGLGATATVTSYPRVVIGGFGNGSKVFNEGSAEETTVPYTRDVHIYGNAYGGGSMAPTNGNTVVMVRDAVIGETEESFTSGNLFGGGYGTTSKVNGATYVGVFGLSDIKSNVYGGGNAGIVTDNTEVVLGYHEQILPPELIAYLDETDSSLVRAGFHSPTPNVHFRYTTDGSIPTTSNGTLYTDDILSPSHNKANDFLIDWDQPIQMIGYLWDGPADEKSGKIDSSMIPSIVGFDKSTMPIITFKDGTAHVGDPDSANFNGSVGARIYYTLNGDEPTSSSTLWGTVREAEGSAFAIGANDVVKAIAVQRGCFNSEVAYLTADPPTVDNGDNTTTFTIIAKPGERIIYTLGTNDIPTPISLMNHGQRPGQGPGETGMTESTIIESESGHTVASQSEGSTVTHKKRVYTNSKGESVTYRWNEVTAATSGNTTVTITVPGGSDCTVKAIVEHAGYAPSNIGAAVYRH